MKKFTKLFLSCALVSALAITASSAAFAAEKDLVSTEGLRGKVTIDDTTGAAAISGLAVNDTVDAGTEVTFLVIKGAVDTTVSDSTVMGIDQNTNAEAGTAVQPTNAGLKTGDDGVVTPDTGTQEYTVMVGYTSNNTFKKATGTFTLGEVVGTERIIGDADFNGKIQAMDATCVARGEKSEVHGHVGEKYATSDPIMNEDTSTATEKNVYIIGDADINGRVQAMDATCIARGQSSADAHGRVGETILLGELIPAAE